jgi:superfamily I DNA and/or RNA helicase
VRENRYQKKAKVLRTQTNEKGANENSIWKRIIDIKSQLLELQSPSFSVKNQTLSKNYVDFEIEDLDEAKFIKKIEAVFQTTVDNSDLHSSFYSESETTSSITEEIIDGLKQEAERNFIDFKGLPIIEGTLTNKGLFDYQQKINKEMIGAIESNKHLIEASDLVKTISILDEYDENIKSIFFLPHKHKLSNEAIKKIRKIKKNQSRFIYSSKMSTSNIMFDVSKYSFNEIKPLLSEIHESLNKNSDLKIKLELKTDFDYHSIVAKLSERKIRSHWNNNKSSLFFWREYGKGNKSLEQRSLDSYINEHIITSKLNLKFEQTDKEKYLLFIDEKKRNLLKNEKIDNLRLIDFCYKDGKQFVAFGTLIKVDYPKIKFRLNDYFKNDASFPSLDNIQPSIKGEKDKVKRLKHTLDNFDSKKNELLKVLSYPDNLNNDFTDDELKSRIKEVKIDCLNDRLNGKQIEAIAKSTLASSLFLIQGPPGTGKSTAISEIIWQHIIREESDNYKILVTSETNLAVDNAINKLTSKTNMLLKPIRFGSSSSVDYEGQRYLFSNLKDWSSNIRTEGFNNENVLDNWIKQVVIRAKETNDDLIGLWTDYLTKKDSLIRSSFYKSYLKHCNIIGSTSGTIGTKSSTNRDTTFYKLYKDVTGLEEINFDLVIQDESSKSTPPELLLPCLYTTKAIILGDHRQLPPMLNTNEFIEEFQQVLKQVDKSKHRQINDSIKFIKTHRKDFDVSFFEKLFLKLDKKAKSSFNVQYRMHPSINNTINQFYKEDEGLFCGLNEESVDDENLSNVSSRYLGQKLFNGAKVVWVDTDSPEILVGTSRVNPTEVDIVTKIISKLSEDEGYLNFKNYWKDDDEKEIGVITFYGAQKQLLQKAIPSNMDCRISVVDRFQGMERNIIICSLVRSNKIAESETSIEETFIYNKGDFSLGFAQSPNRLNVALSRAKRLLIIVGNSEHFSQKEIYTNVYKSIQDDPKGLIIDSKEFMASE